MLVYYQGITLDGCGRSESDGDDKAGQTDQAAQCLFSSLRHRTGRGRRRRALPATAFYYLRDENYLISKKHVLSAIENYEYIYIDLADHLTAEDLQRKIDLSRQAGMSHIKPNKEHMSSFVTLVVLADTIDPEAKALIKKTRFRKNFRLALHGWMEYRIAAMEIATNSFLSNPAAKEARKLLEANFAPKKH